jgi:acetyl/propionyl-CoA carboxylase alpha subunit
MSEALGQTVVLGVVTNLARLRAIVAHPAFAAGDLHTGFIEEHLAGHRTPASPPPVAIAALAVALRTAGKRGRRAVPDPWTRLGSWRIGGGA